MLLQAPVVAWRGLDGGQGFVSILQLSPLRAQQAPRKDVTKKLRLAIVSCHQARVSSLLPNTRLRAGLENTFSLFNFPGHQNEVLGGKWEHPSSTPAFSGGRV